MVASIIINFELVSWNDRGTSPKLIETIFLIRSQNKQIWTEAGLSSHRWLICHLNTLTHQARNVCLSNGLIATNNYKRWCKFQRTTLLHSITWIWLRHQADQTLVLFLCLTILWGLLTKTFIMGHKYLHILKESSLIILPSQLIWLLMLLLNNVIFQTHPTFNLGLHKMNLIKNKIKIFCQLDKVWLLQESKTL